MKRFQSWNYLGEEHPGRGDDNCKGLEVGTGLICARPAWKEGQNGWNSVNEGRMVGDVSRGRQAGPDQVGSFRPQQKFGISS